ncbi:Sodium:neurotransmitter symporter [Trinorchestia longiramus]|nr:Sodium:neurotransmitter symporter [Trinorchestia longiramus]
MQVQDVTRVVVTGGGDLQPLVSSPASLAPSSPMGMLSLHQSDCVSYDGQGGDSERTTHFPALRHDSPTRPYDAASSPSPLYSPSQSPSKHNHSSHHKVLPASPLTKRSTPSRHSHNPSASFQRSGTNALTRHSHPSTSTPSNSVSSTPTLNGITLTPASNDTSKIIHEKNKSVTIVLGEQQVTYSTPSRQTSMPEPSDDQSSISKASYIVRITEGADSPKINSVTCIDTTNEVDTLKSKARLESEASDKGVSKPIMAGHARKLSYNSTAYTTNGSSSYSSANGVMKSWQDAYSAGFQEEASDDWRRSTSTLVPSAKLKAGDHVSWRSVASLVTGAALVLSAAAFLRLPGLLVVYGPGTFVPVVVLCLLLVGAPLALLEAGLAQFSSCSVIAVWRLLPLARGIGWSLVLLCGMWGVYTAGLAAPWLHYFLVTTAPPGAIQSVEVSNCSWASTGDAEAALLYFRHCVYGTSAEGGVGFSWPLPAGVLSLCFCAFLGAAGGASLQAVFSGIALAVALTGSVTQGCLAGWQVLTVLSHLSLAHLVAPLLTPTLDILASPQVWLAGLGQALLMLGPGTALLLNHASRFQFRFRVRRHIVVLTVLSVLVTLLVAVVTVLQMGLIRVEDLRSQQSAVYSKREAKSPFLPRNNFPSTILPSSNSDQASQSSALHELPNTVSSLGLIGDFAEQKQSISSVRDGSFSSVSGKLFRKKKRSLIMDEDLNDSITTESSELLTSTFTPMEMKLSSSLPPVQSSLPPLESTLPILSLMSANSQTAQPDPSRNSNSGSSRDITAGSRIKDNEAPYPKPQTESDDQFKFTSEVEGFTEATPPSTTCVDTSADPLDSTISPPPGLPAVTSSEHCFLRSIKHGASVHGPCSHQEVSTGGVFLLISHSLLYYHVPMEWLRPIFAATILCGVLCSGLGTVCGCLCVASVAGRESSHVAAVVGAGVGLLFTLLGAAPLVAENGLQLLSLLDVGVITPAIVWPATLMTVAIATAHGMGKIRKDFIFIIEKDISIMWVVWWAFIIPVTLVGVFVWQCVDWWRYGYSYRVFNDTTAVPTNTETETVYILWWQMTLLWALRVLLILPIPIVAIKVINSQLAYGIKDKLVSALQSSREWGEWGPQDPIEHHNWRRWREDETRPFASLERRLANRPLTYTHSTLSRNSSGGSSLSKLRSKYQRKELPIHATATAL